MGCSKALIACNGHGRIVDFSDNEYTKVVTMASDGAACKLWGQLTPQVFHKFPSICSN
jgi:hypothetical protein